MWLNHHRKWQPKITIITEGPQAGKDSSSTEYLGHFGLSFEDVPSSIKKGLREFNMLVKKPGSCWRLWLKKGYNPSKGTAKQDEHLTPKMLKGCIFWALQLAVSCWGWFLAQKSSGFLGCFYTWLWSRHSRDVAVRILQSALSWQIEGFFLDQWG